MGVTTCSLMDNERKGEAGVDEGVVYAAYLRDDLAAGLSPAREGMV